MLPKNLIRLFFIYVLFLSFFLNELHANSYIEINSSITYAVCRYIDTNGTWSYNIPNVHDIGRDNGSNQNNPNSDSDIYRSIYYFDLSELDEDAIIQSVSLSIQSGYFENNYSMEIGSYFEDPNSQSEEEIWNKADDGYLYYDNVGYAGGDLSENNDLKDDIQNSLPDRKFFIAIISKAEDTNLSYCDNITLTLKIHFLDQVDVTVINTFEGGSFKMDGIVYDSGITLTLTEDEIHSFENWDQTYNGVDYIFKAKWTNLTTGEVYTGNPVDISFTYDATLRAEFAEKVHIIVKNRHDGGQLKVDSDTHNSGAEFDFEKYSLHDFESWEQTYGGFDMKFKDGKKWEMTERTYNTALVEDHEVTTAGTYRAQLYQQYHYTADNDFMNGGSGGTIIINGESKTITTPDPYSGNTLEDDPFTVEAPQQTQTVNGRTVTYNFVYWEDGSTDNPRNLTPNNHFDIVANYKGHMFSNNSYATGYNNGRRIYKSSDGTIYMVYEDNDDIWFTSSTDGGKTWSKETRLDSNNKKSLNPSIAGTLDMLFVTWFDQTDLNIKLRRFNINTSQWYNAQTVASVNFGDAIKPAPAIAVSEVVGNEYNVYIAFHREKMSDNFQPTGIHEIVCYKNSDQNFDQWNVVLGPFEGSNPSLSHSKTGSNGDIGLVWDHNGKIYFKGTNYYGNWTATQQISDDLWYHQDNCKPNISYTSGIAHIVWEGFHAITEMPTGYYRYFKVYEERLSDLTILPSHGADVRHLSVSSRQYADNTTAYDYTVVYEGDGIVKVTQTSDNFEEENFGEGQYPNITEHDMSRSVWTKYNDAPYLLKTDYVESSGSGISPIIINPTPVIDYVISANQNNSVEGTITLEVEAVKFNHDTVYFDNALKSKTMSVTQDYIPLEMDLKVRFHNVYNGFNDEDVLYSLVFEDSTQGEIFRVLQN
ncbi:hypothetical protein ACX8XN_03200 [Calditrichota bacterium GD2]